MQYTGPFGGPRVSGIGPFSSLKQKKIGISDLDLDQLESNIRRVFNRCEDKYDHPVELERIIIFGSVARGQAKQNESDLDLRIYTSNPVGNEMKPKYDLTVEKISGCMQESDEAILKDIQANLTDVDMLAFSITNFESSLTARLEGEEVHKAYNLTSREFVTVEEIKTTTTRGV